VAQEMSAPVALDTLPRMSPELVICLKHALLLKNHRKKGKNAPHSIFPELASRNTNDCLAVGERARAISPGVDKP
jgi:hypothetical protein